MKKGLNEKYVTISKYVIAVFTICVLIVVCVVRYKGLFDILNSVFTVIRPVIWGAVFAYLANPILNFIETYVKKLTERKKPHPTLTRAISATITTVLILAVFGTLIAIIIPQVSRSVINIVLSAKTYISRAEGWINAIKDSYPTIYTYFISVFEELEVGVEDIIKNYSPQLSSLATGATTALKSFAIGIKDFLLGFIVMVYLLCGKENFKGQIKKIIYVIFNENAADKILEVTARADKTFIGFISGKAVDSLIIGLLCFIGMQFMGVRYAGMQTYSVLISVIIGVTNMIPFFGPFFGAIPSVILLFFESPKEAVIFAIFVLILQQFDGNILGPKILGDSTGLPVFWVMFAILVGGGLFGFVGMLVGVPFFAVIYDLSREYINDGLKKKNLPTSAKLYQGSEKIEQIREEQKASSENEPQEAAPTEEKTEEKTEKKKTK